MSTCRGDNRKSRTTRSIAIRSTSRALFRPRLPPMAQRIAHRSAETSSCVMEIPQRSWPNSNGRLGSHSGRWTARTASITTQTFTHTSCTGPCATYSLTVGTKWTSPLERQKSRSNALAYSAWAQMTITTQMKRRKLPLSMRPKLKKQMKHKTGKTNSPKSWKGARFRLLLARSWELAASQRAHMQVI